MTTQYKVEHPAESSQSELISPCVQAHPNVCCPMVQTVFEVHRDDPPKVGLCVLNFQWVWSALTVPGR